MASYIGTSGDDKLGGTDGADTYDIGLGGEDTVQAGAGDDTIFGGGGFDPGDRLDGGDGADTLALDGDYGAGVVFAKTTIRNIETISLTGGHDYGLTLDDGNLTGMGVLHIDAYGQAGDQLVVDASALVAGHGVYVNAANQTATLAGGAGDDTMFVSGSGSVQFDGGDGNDALILYRQMTRADHFKGGDVGGLDTDQLDLYTGMDVVFTGKMLSHARMLALQGGDFDLTMANGNVAAGDTLTVFANNALAGEVTRFDGHAERDGHYQYIGGVEGDTVIGGQSSDQIYGYGGDDSLTGGKGADTLEGGDGADTFVFTKAGESSNKAHDLITDFDAASDHIDLGAIDARTDVDGDQAFRLVGKFTHVSGQMVMTYDAGADVTHVQGDVNGDGKADLVIDVAGQLTDTAGFVL